MKRITKIDLLAAVVYTTIPGAAAEMNKLLDIPPSDCSKCRHKQYPEGGHCYMFRNQPSGNCGQYDPVKSKDTGKGEKKIDT